MLILIAKAGYIIDPQASLFPLISGLRDAVCDATTAEEKKNVGYQKNCCGNTV